MLKNIINFIFKEKNTKLVKTIKNNRKKLQKAQTFNQLISNIQNLHGNSQVGGAGKNSDSPLYNETKKKLKIFIG